MNRNAVTAASSSPSLLYARARCCFFIRNLDDSECIQGTSYFFFCLKLHNLCSSAILMVWLFQHRTKIPFNIVTMLQVFFLFLYFSTAFCCCLIMMSVCGVQFKGIMNERSHHHYIASKGYLWHGSFDCLSTFQHP